MNQASGTSTIGNGSDSGQKRALAAALWVLQAVLAVQFALGGAMKLGGSADMVDMFRAIGAGDWLRYLVGVCELAGAVGLLIPRLSGVAALGLLGLLIAASATNQFVLHISPAFPIGLVVVSGLVAWGRWSRTRALISGLLSLRSSSIPASRRNPE